MAARSPWRVVIGAGGSAGDVMPGIALAHALAARGAEAAILGGEHGLEAQLVPAASVAFEALYTQPLFGAGRLRPLRIPYALWRGREQAVATLRRIRPALVIGFGGHASVAPVLAARQLGIPTALYEANARAGVANALLASFVDRVFVAEPNTRWPLAPRAREAVGGVLRPELEQRLPIAHTFPCARPRHLLVLSGLQGSCFLNERVTELLAALHARDLPFEVWHQAGLRAERVAIAARYRQLGIPARVDAYLADPATAYEWADFAISAAGAGTIAELWPLRCPRCGSQSRRWRVAISSRTPTRIDVARARSCARSASSRPHGWQASSPSCSPIHDATKRW